MNIDTQSEFLLTVTEKGLAARSASDFLDYVVAEVRGFGGASTAAVIVSTGDGPVVSHHDGLEVPAVSIASSEGLCRQMAIAPVTWQGCGVASVLVQQLPGHLGSLVFGWTGSDPWAEEPAGSRPPFETLLVAIASLLETLARMESNEALADLGLRVQGAQQLAGMGDYDWHIASDTNLWSDQLYRIYGHEPQSFNASYDRFLEAVHPDDRERVKGVHEVAYASGEPYAMIERIVRPDGELRYLSSSGEVIHDADGAPVRMRGTCIDVTERVLAEQEREQVAARFRSLVEAAPEAILVVDADGHVVQANPQATALVGAEPIGHAISEILATNVKTGRGQAATGLDGTDLILDVTEVELSSAAQDSQIAFYLADAVPRIEREALAQRLTADRLRRRQAFEINDNVVQGLTAASYALELSDFDAVRTFLDRTLESARGMMGDLLEPSGNDLAPGDLVRAIPAALGQVPRGDQLDYGTELTISAIAATTPGPRVLIVDDCDDLRMLLRIQLGRLGRFDVVGEAIDGRDAVEKARQLQPDLVLLDMAMPRMDGLQALPLIREVVPNVRVIALTGFDQGTLEERALAAGANGYVTKGGLAKDLIATIASVLEAA